MDTQAVKGRAVAAIALALGLLVLVIFLIRAGKSPVILALMAIAFGVYGLRMLWQLKKQGQTKV